MRALLLAAGRGERMRPLTDTVPKPLLPVGGRALIEWQIEAMVRAGIRELVINTAHLAVQLEAALGDGQRYGARIRYSREGTQAGDALETLGGIVRALPMLGDQAFVLASGDIVTDFDYASLMPAGRVIEQGRFDGHLVLVENPPYHPAGDMNAGPAMADGAGPEQGEATLVASRDPVPGEARWQFTYANIAVLSPRLFAGLSPVRARLFPWLFGAVERGRISAQLWRGGWWNVGTPQELATVDAIKR
jgi:MurNAc alpha-1-phosphate uridylyltransferase